MEYNQSIVRAWTPAELAEKEITMISVPVCIRTSAALMRKACPPRRQDTHKGDYGRVLLLTGAEGYTGAPVLAARAALRTGAGLIFTGVPRAVYPIAPGSSTAPMVFPLPDCGGKLSLDALPAILERLKTADACLLGPGLGRSADLDQLIPKIIEACRCPLVLDADGINAVAGHIDVVRGAACPVILTPHEGEFRRLYPDAPADRLAGAMALARRPARWCSARGTRPSLPTASGCLSTAPAMPAWPPAAAGTCLRAFSRRCWDKACRPCWRRRPALAPRPCGGSGGGQAGAVRPGAGRSPGGHPATLAVSGCDGTCGRNDSCHCCWRCSSPAAPPRNEP